MTTNASIGKNTELLEVLLGEPLQDAEQFPQKQSGYEQKLTHLHRAKERRYTRHFRW